MKLYERANEILAAREAERIAQEKRKQEELNTAKKNLLAEFETEFADYLPMLAEAGISWGADFNDPRYTHQGSYIYFEHQDRFLKMDFCSAETYRFFHEENPLYVLQDHGVYGKWDKDPYFILFIAQNFPLEKPKVIDFIQKTEPDDDFEVELLHHLNANPNSCGDMNCKYCGTIADRLRDEEMAYQDSAA